MPTLYRILRYDGTEEWLAKIKLADAIKDDAKVVFRWNPTCEIESRWLSPDETEVLQVFNLFHPASNQPCRPHQLQASPPISSPLKTSPSESTS